MFYIITKNNCPNCEILKKQIENLKDYKEGFTFINVSNNFTLIDHIKSLGYKAIPIIFKTDIKLNINSDLMNKIIIKDNYVGTKFNDLKL